jgi:hypothetical protein
MNHLDPIRALKIIEGIALARFESDDYDSIATDLYSIAHKALNNCRSSHIDFYKRALKIEEELVNHNFIGPWEK